MGSSSNYEYIYLSFSYPTPGCIYEANPISLKKAYLFSHVPDSTVHNSEEWNQPGCLLIDKYKENVLYVGYLAIKTHEILTCALNWMMILILLT